MTSEARIMEETGLARRVGLLAEPVLEDMGFELVRVRISARDGCTVQIMAERPDGTMTVEDCADVSRALSALLDVEDPIEGEYQLEISSPGIDRPLVRRRDFERWAGHEAKIELAEMLEGRKRFRGILAGLSDDHVIVRAAPAGADAPAEHSLPLAMVAEARLVMTDALIEASLKAGKQAAKAQAREAAGAAPDDSQQQTFDA